MFENCEEQSESGRCFNAKSACFPLSFSYLAILKISSVLLLNFLTGRTDEVGKSLRKMHYPTSGFISYNYIFFLSQKMVLSTAGLLYAFGII